MSVRWQNKVMLWCERSRQYFVVNSAEEAFAFLASDFPDPKGSFFLAALEICGEASPQPELSRFAFVLAVEEAGMSISGIAFLEP